MDLTDEELRLCGDVAGKRLLDLGCGRGESCVTFASRGAKVIGIDQSADDLAYARRLVEEEERRVELRHGDLADLAFLPPASVDVAFSAGALSYVSDPGRVFRQVHRVLKTGAPLVFSVVHPASRLDMSSYWAGYTIADLYGGLQRANFEVDTLLEPEPTRTAPPTLAPQTLVMRGRKLGL